MHVDEYLDEDECSAYEALNGARGCIFCTIMGLVVYLTLYLIWRSLR